MKLQIIIPAYNEENRIERTLRQYVDFFSDKQFETTILVVLNGCVDNTKQVVEKFCVQNPIVKILDLKEVAGKGIAIREGFLFAHSQLKGDIIGFVDADMATVPEEFFKLVSYTASYDCVIASRYMPGAKIYPERPKYKRLGSRFVYEPLIKLLFGMSYYDFQCGAKIFNRHVIAKIVDNLLVEKWAIDLELLYLCKKNNFCVKEVPTVWCDQNESKMTLAGGIGMLASLFYIRYKHSFFGKKSSTKN